MGLNRIAAYAVLVGSVGCVVAAVAYFDWRAGVVVASLLLMAGGIQSLRSRNG